MEDLTRLCVSPDCLLREAIQAIDLNEKGIILVVDANQKLIATVTDGDIRRRLLEGAALDARLLQLFDWPPRHPPIWAHEGTSGSALLTLMRRHAVRQVPLLDAEQRVVGLATLEALLPEEAELPMQAVIMAGGRGTRLLPLTEDLPKPMLPVGGRPLLELTLEQFRRHGISRVNVATHYKAHAIEGHFGNGKDFGVEIRYIQEETPLGTAGALALMEPPSEPLLVVNGDILTEVDYRALLQFHRDHQADLTVGVRSFEIQVPYGVVESMGAMVQGLAEKPVYNFLVNAGIYLLEPRAHALIPGNQHYDFTDLIQQLLASKMRVVSFPIREYWLDIGKHEDYVQAQDYVPQQAARR
ncbi:CBS domain-containing protein [bacterium CPR1]|nr:CBS domain-containing protein [bacterium CPR1]